MSAASFVANAAAAAGIAAAAGMCRLSNATALDVVAVSSSAFSAVTAAIHVRVSDSTGDPPGQGISGAPALAEGVFWGVISVGLTVATARSQPRWPRRP